MKKNYFFKSLVLFFLGMTTIVSMGQTTFNYTGGQQTYVVPAGLTSIAVDVIGAEGGYSYNSQTPGLGGRLQAEYSVIPGQTLYIYVGGKGEDDPVRTGGWNGGGDGSTGDYGGGGGGASDIRIGGTTLADRIFVSGGGGGSGYNGTDTEFGGNGGDLIGADGNVHTNGIAGGTPGGGTQVAGGVTNQWPGYAAGTPGAFGIGGNAATGTGGAGGGAGYYGGGGGSWAGGGGGSSYSDGLATSVVHTQGYNSGNGQVVITKLCDDLTISTTPSTTVCPGTMVTITATSINGGTITWDNGIINGVPFLATATTTYTSTSTDPIDCVEMVTITVQDLINPTITCPGNQVGNVDGSCQFTLPDYTGLATTTDNCTVSPTITQVPAPGTNVGTGTTNIVLTATDGSSNTANCNFDVVVTDVTNPTITCPGNQVGNVDVSCQFTLLDYTGLATTTDNCTVSPTITQIPAPGTNVGTGTTNIVLTATDGSSNTANCNFDVVITDVTAPVADLGTLADVIDECEVTSLTDPTATDNCAGLVTVTNDATLPINTQGTTVVTWTYDDGNGNTSTQTQNVVITDITAPVADLGTLADVTAECEVTSLTDPTATDNCAGLVTVTNDATLPINAQGTTVVTWTYDDGNGNTSTQTQNVIITDVTAPVADIASLVDATDECSVTPTIPTATDNCLGTINGTTTETFPIIAQGTTVITWTYDDGNGNTSTQTQNVIITDVTDPTIICQNDTVVCDPLVNYLAPVGQDNCTVQSTVLTLGLGSGSTFPLGITTEEYTVTDNVGNTATCSFTITVATPSVVDLGIDTIICQWDTLVLDAGVFDTYLWSEGSTTQTISVDSTGLGLGTHVFYVEITDTNGCVAVDTISITIDICSSIAKNDLENLIQVYPNPSTGIYTISADRDYSFVITDITGKQIYNGKLESTESQIDISDQAQGIYLIKFVSDEHNTTIKLIKK